jgi:V/A-type H+-transporting ATPase subunit B
MTEPIVRVHGGSGASGPLLFMRGGDGIALGERVVVEAPGAPTRIGELVEVSGDVAVVQMLVDTIGLAPGEVTITLTGRVARAVVGRELLGRSLDGAGHPIDGLPAPVGEALLPLAGAPLNPARRLPPSDFIETGISAVDGLNTLVRGQKLPVFSGPGLPAMDLAARLATWARAPRDEPFAVVFVGLGVTDREARRFLRTMEASGAAAESTIYLNRAGDPTSERLIAPRIALTQAEFLAFEHGMHVLVVIADVLHYCDALREVSAAREEIPARRGYPGYMYTDLASLFERAGIAEGRAGSVTQIPILTMPDDDITHPIPDLTGYITEGQLVLSRELDRRGVWPPIDVLPSLSRLMNAGIGEARTVPEHREWANQLYALYARGREARLTAAVVGEASLGALDRQAIDFADRFELEFVGQGHNRRRIAETMEIGWSLMEAFPRDELTRLSAATLDARPAAVEPYPAGSAVEMDPAGAPEGAGPVGSGGEAEVP